MCLWKLALKLGRRGPEGVIPPWVVFLGAPKLEVNVCESLGGIEPTKRYKEREKAKL